MTETLGHQQSHLLSENFGNCVAKDSFGGWIREQDDAVLVNADDGVRRSLRNDAEQFTGFVAAAIVVHSSPSDVLQHTDQPREELYLSRGRAGGSFLNWSAV